ncbi:MAG: hypothetical protein IT193_16960 [Propionibacteriaceae bacterium]|nr:hypothetical protein [Propionibacteriaceae bacterium]
MESLPVAGLVWGGDWNHAMQGREYTGSVTGRTTIKDKLDRLHLNLPTAASPHRVAGLFSIDHIAVPADAHVHSVTRIIAEDPAGNRLSDHDAYTTEVTLT